MSLEELERQYGSLMFLKCCTYWPIHAYHLNRGVGRCTVCKKQMEIVNDYEEIQRLRLTATELAEGLRIWPPRRESNIRFLRRCFQWFLRGQVGPIPQRQDGRGDPTGPGSPWYLG